jgi:integrase/recombinase XerD
VLATSHGGPASSLRHHAMRRLLARRGLRAQDVAALCVAASDWADGRVGIRPGKPHQARSVPLPQAVGQARVAYLPRGRPRRDHRQGCLQGRPPFHPLPRSAVWWVGRHAFQGAGMAPRPRCGSHIFRHPAAAWMLKHGASVNDIAAVVGPRSLQTTEISAQLAGEALAAVALPWLGGAPCRPTF